MNRSWEYRIGSRPRESGVAKFKDGIKALEANARRRQTPARLCATVSAKPIFGVRDFEPEQPKLPRSSSATVRGAAI
jgi:hypothetical protein